MEDLALSYLQKQGLGLVTRRFRVKRGEIDLICTQGQVLVFIEVRYRAFGSSPWKLQTAAASITRSKQKNIIFAAKMFLLQHPNWRSFPCRFDVVTLEGVQESPKVSWIKGAFQV